MSTFPETGPTPDDESQDNSTTSSSPQAVTFCGGTAWAGSELVNFQQAGRGKPVLMLAAGAGAGTEPELALALAERFRVVLPCLGQPNGGNGGSGTTTPPDHPAITPVGETIELFLDTLGFARVTLVATPPYASAALAYALMDAERVERLVIFIDDRLRNGTPIPLLSDRLSGAGIPLAALAWPDTQPGNMRVSCVAAVIAEVTSFLGE